MRTQPVNDSFPRKPLLLPRPVAWNPQLVAGRLIVQPDRNRARGRSFFTS